MFRKKLKEKNELTLLKIKIIKFIFLNNIN